MGAVTRCTTRNSRSIRCDIAAGTGSTRYTTGLVGLLGSHMIDVALWFMNDPFPLSAVALGDILTWKDGRQISDTAE